MAPVTVTFDENPEDFSLPKQTGDVRIVPALDARWKWHIYIARNDESRWYGSEFRSSHNDAEEVFLSVLALMSYGEVSRIVMCEEDYHGYFKKLFNRPQLPHRVVMPMNHTGREQLGIIKPVSG